MDEELTIGEWIRLRRRVLDLTQDALANLSGLSVATIRKIESGERRPSRQSAELMARALEVPPEKTPVFLRLCRSQAYFPPLNCSWQMIGMHPSPSGPS
jgi:transcriptional regulator with XRE-family HTH domain